MNVRFNTNVLKIAGITFGASKPKSTSIAANSLNEDTLTLQQPHKGHINGVPSQKLVEEFKSATETDIKSLKSPSE